MTKRVYYSGGVSVTSVWDRGSGTYLLQVNSLELREKKGDYYIVAEPTRGSFDLDGITKIGFGITVDLRVSVGIVPSQLNKLKKLCEKGNGKIPVDSIEIKRYSINEPYFAYIKEKKSDKIL